MSSRVLDLVVSCMILSFQDVSVWELRKMVRDSWEGQKRISYICTIAVYRI